VFISDIRFKMEVYTNLRYAYQTVAKISDLVTIDLIRGKLNDRRDALSKHFVKALDELHFETEEISENQFNIEVARMEKHALVSFANLLYKQVNSKTSSPEENIIQGI